MSKDVRINQQIRSREVRLIGSDAQQLGIVSISEALRKAEEENLDLVEVSSTSRPPVCKLMDFGKYKFEQSKKLKEARKNQRGDVKEIKISHAGITARDLQVKMNHVIRFLEHGDKARLIVEFRGREQIHRNKGFDILNDMAEQLKDVGIVERRPTLEGRRIVMVINPKKVERRESSEKTKDENAQDRSQAV